MEHLVLLQSLNNRSTNPLVDRQKHHWQLFWWSPIILTFFSRKNCEKHSLVPTFFRISCFSLFSIIVKWMFFYDGLTKIFADITLISGRLWWTSNSTVLSLLWGERLWWFQGPTRGEAHANCMLLCNLTSHISPAMHIAGSVPPESWDVHPIVRNKALHNSSYRSLVP